MKKKSNILRFFYTFIFSIALSLNPINSIKVYSSSALSDLVAGLVKNLGDVSNLIEGFFKNSLKCDQLDWPSLIAMLPVSYATSATLESQGIMNMLSGKVSVASICATNVIKFKAAMLGFDISYEIYKATEGSEDTASIIIHYSALLSAITAVTYAFTNVLANYAYSTETADNATICLQNDGNAPMPYTDSEMSYLLGEMNVTNTVANINSYNNKLCVNYNGQYLWLENGECTSDSTHPICVQNMKGYSNILCAVAPIGCPCIMNIQHGISTLPTFQTDANGNVVRDASGNPVFTVDPSQYGVSFLQNCRIVRVPGGDYQPKTNTAGIVDEVCANMKGHSKRQFPMTGGIVECMTNTARNVFEKPIFANVFSSTGANVIYNNINNNYELDMSSVLFYQDNINAIVNGKPFSSLSSETQANVAQQINAFLSTQTQEYCFVCAASGPTNTANTKTILQKYSNLSSTAGPCNVINPGSCITNPTTPIQQTIASSASNYTNLITDIYVSEAQQYTAMDILHILSNYQSSSGADLQIASQQSINAVFNSLYASILAKKNTNDYINSLYAQSSAGKNSILTWSLFDKFNNQIKYISVFILTIWLLSLGYRILTNEFKVSESELVALAMQVVLFYYIVIADFWKTFLFSFVISISQGIGTAALEIGDIAGQYTTGNCNYSASTMSATFASSIKCPSGYTAGACLTADSNGDCTSANCTSTTLTPATVAATITQALSCKGSTNIEYQLECTNIDKNTGNCISGTCIPQNSYIVRPNYEYPFIPVSYYSTIGALSCANISSAPSPSTIGEWVDIPVCCTNGLGHVIDAEKVLNNSLGYYVYYCPNSSYTLDEGYRLSILNSVFSSTTPVISGYNATDVIPTALRTTNNYGMVNNTVVVETQNKSAINLRVANATDLETFRANANLTRTYPILKVNWGNNNTSIRDLSYLKFFDQLDCKVMRFLFLGLGSPGQTDINLSTMDTNSLVNGVLSVIKMVFGFFPFGILVFILMMFIAITLFILIIRAVQTYIVGMFGLVMQAYISPFFFMMGLFPSFKSARDNSIKNILGYAIVPPICFLSLGIYFFILDIAFFGDPSNYSQLFDATGNISSTCYNDNPSDAPLACLVNKIVSQINPDEAFGTLILNIALGMYAGVWGVVGANLISSLFGITDTIQLFLPFISKLATAVLLIVGGLSVADTIDETMKSLVGMDVNTKTGFLDGGAKESTMGMLNVVKSFFG